VDSFTSEYLHPESGETPSEEEQDIIKWSSAALYAGGADTVSCTLFFFFPFSPKDSQLDRFNYDYIFSSHGTIS